MHVVLRNGDITTLGAIFGAMRKRLAVLSMKYQQEKLRSQFVELSHTRF